MKRLFLFIASFLLLTFAPCSSQKFLRPALENNESITSLPGDVIGRGLRKLIGSNCLLVERGDYPPFYECIGCVIEEAQACVDDMRYNKSLNVPAKCAMYATSQQYDSTHCCPVIQATATGKVDLLYVGAAYPMALSCIERVGCKSSTIYSQLLKECLTICPYTDVRNQQSVCYATFNAAAEVQSMKLLFWLVVLVMSILMAS